LWTKHGPITPKRHVTAGQAPTQPMIDSYARLSWNPDTLELEKIHTQFKDNRATIARHGGVLGLELSDGLSAWKRNVRRPDFETLMERATSGVTQGIAIWLTDRLFRQPRDLERHVDLAKSGFLITVRMEPGICPILTTCTSCATR
jgi:site-specific DNA recombinase